MANIPTITGVLGVLRQLKVRDDQLAKDFERGSKKAGLALQAASQKLTPVEFGPLRASAFTRALGSGFGQVVWVGYTSAYAADVHERVQMRLKGQPRTPNPPHKGRYWDPQGQATAKFLEKPARSMSRELRGIILNQMRIRL